MVFIIQWFRGDDSEEKVVYIPPSNDVQEYKQSRPVIEKNKTRSYDNGVFVEDFLNDKRHGYGVYMFSNGDKYEGNWKNGKKHGYGVSTWYSGRKYEGDWQNNNKHGQNKMFYIVEPHMRKLEK